MDPTIAIDDSAVALHQLQDVALRRAGVRPSTDARWQERIGRSRQLLEEAINEERPVYGVSTGVGNRSSVKVAKGLLDEHAYSIIRHHGCGVGDAFSEPEVRAIIFARLVSLAKGVSAVRLGLLEAMCDLLENDVIPVVPRLGSVGASGDLTPLSYIAAVLVGEREATYKGEMLPAPEALSRAGLEPFRMVAKESIALMNGTSVMTAVGVLTALRFERTLTMVEGATALAAELMCCNSGAYHPLAQAVKPHPGQIESAAHLYAALQGSELIDQPREGRIIQDPYSIRCAPQVLGAARDALTWTKDLLRRELNSANDNPIVDPDSGEILFAGNFYGGHVALTMDLLKVTAATVADMIDRQLALLMDSRFNLGLPETLVDYGGNGLKGMQLTTTALTALAAQRSTSDSVQSRSTEVGNQDKVSMGLNAALNASEVVTLVQQALATELIALSNAAELRGTARLSPAGQELVRGVREHSEPLTEDRRVDVDIAGLVALIEEGQ